MPKLTTRWVPCQMYGLCYYVYGIYVATRFAVPYGRLQMFFLYSLKKKCEKQKSTAKTVLFFLYPGRDLNPHAIADSRFWVYRVYHSATRASIFEVIGRTFSATYATFSLSKSGAKLLIFFDMEKFFFKKSDYSRKSLYLCSLKIK